LLTDKTEIEAIITGCINADQRSQEKLYRSFYKAMMNLCLRYTKNETDALQALNSGFYKVFKGIKTFDVTKGSLYTWLSTIIIHSCIDLLNKKPRNGHHVELEKADDICTAPEVSERIKADEILRLIKELPETTRTVFNLFVIEGYSHKEIGSFLSLSEGTSKWHLSEARRMLQQKIKMKEVYE
jgi:RNA polymerase sigma-70 factor (ECF subfamily)